MSEHAVRRDALRSDIIASGADGLLVRNLSDLRYLTGFTGSSGVLYVAADERLDVLATDGRYAEQAGLQCPDLGVLIERRPLTAACQQVASGGADRIAIDAAFPVSALEDLRRIGLDYLISDAGLSAARARKSPEEIDALERACRITVDALDATAMEIRTGMTEIRIARMIEGFLGDLGAQDRSFETIVAAGPNSAMPHHAPGSRPLSAGDLVIIDCGALVDGYHADMTRTFVVGEPAPWQLHLHAAVNRAAAEARSLVSAGVLTRDVDAAARESLGQDGLADHFGHGTGHGIGLDIHEAPMIGIATEGRLLPNMTITVEPGAYLPGRGGIRIEDSLLVLDEGHRVLTECSRDLCPVG